MRIEFEITDFPADPGGYNLIAHTEGVLRVIVGDAAFLDASGILLVELAVALRAWLSETTSVPADFDYTSMDFEEAPILAFRYDSASDRFRLDSVWSDADVGAVSRETVASAANTYLSRLAEELARTHGVDLEARLNESA